MCNEENEENEKNDKVGARILSDSELEEYINEENNENEENQLDTEKQKE